MKESHKYTSIIIKILLMLSIMLAVLTVFINCFVLNKNTYINMLNKEGTYKKVTESIYSKIDSVLKEKNINYDIKESLITEDDIKRESDTAITGLIEYLKTGENNMNTVDTTVYKQRVSDILKSFVGGSNLLSENTSQDEKNNLANGEIAFNDQLKSTNLSCSEGKIIVQNLDNAQGKVETQNIIYVQNKSDFGSNNMIVEKLASRSEIEDQVRKKLAEKGISEDQARQMLKDRGISEEQAWKMLGQQGITPDDDNKDETSNDSSSKGSSDATNANAAKSQSNSDDNSSQESSSNQNEIKEGNSTSNSNHNGNVKDKLNSISDDKKSIIQNQLDSIVNKLADEAGNIIDKEVQKISLNSLMNSSKIQTIAKVISIFYKMRVAFIIAPIVLAIALLMLEKNVISIVKWIGISLLFSGVFLLAISLGGNMFKIYNIINVNTDYLKDIICNTVKRFLSILSIFGIITFVVGAILMIPTRMYINKHKYN
ncbi:hypothetical protein [Clostridium saccharobutylicum]|uniref:Uncharacterized protein n=1 Tax=Clostridium saccharobutylicum DSM 13864 TaxID=1345695 RepID=U5MX99_CLOSA|nr:hypothetical protein [Clostridium saccharobutylicum]AGX45173.1 hypothetical protein CLSA_c42130 [Clostridium saccharobutylicum DSM 13864]AQR92451.1 hypothetical protein CLOSC_41810 [Clostridium saccharobutylicum]AQS02354.1 hypothetical protein CSACC_41870 [Clostridium saccharobutylicum]AQS16337.1 hypothetical protein CLOSACC_41870 [Clostridium saccharobutylicum]MBA2905016.1 hypothetical protein [Clostridium saccharobutylicum]